MAICFSIPHSPYLVIRHDFVVVTSVLRDVCALFVAQPPFAVVLTLGTEVSQEQ